MELPGKQMVKPVSAGVEGSLRQAAYPWMALGSVGDTLMDIGEKGMKLVVEAKRSDTRRRANEMELDLSRLHADYENQMLRNPDPTTWMDGYKGMVEKVRGKYISEKLAPEEQEILGTRFAEWEARTSIGVARSAALAIFQKDKLAAANLIEEGERTGNDHLRMQGLATVRELLGPEEAEKQMRESNRRVDRTRLETEVQQRPAEIQKMIDDGTLLENYPGLHQDDQTWARDAARTRSRVIDGDILDKYANLVASKVLRTPDDVLQKFPDVEPRLLEKMVLDIQKRNNAELMNDPANQQEVIGEITSRLSVYKMPADGSHDYMLDELTLKAYELPEGPLRTNALERIRNKRQGLETKVKTRGDAAQRALDTHFESLSQALPKAGKFKVDVKMRDGLFKDIKKLQLAGFSESQAKIIRDLYKEDPAKAQKKVQELWKVRKEGNVLLDPFDAKLMDAFRTEKPYMDWEDPETEDRRIQAELEHNLKIGKAKMQLDEWLSMNPEPTEEKLREKVLELAGEGVEDDLQREIDLLEEENAIPEPDMSSLGLPPGSDLVGLIKHFETFKEDAYEDNGTWSIGYGTPGRPGQKISHDEAVSAMMNQINSARAKVRKEAARIGIEFTQNEEDALTSFTYNTKPGNLEQLLANGTRTKQEIAQMMLFYRNASGRRLKGLERRRRAEQAMFLGKL